ncbi:hypothetical protein ACFWFZ_21355 [Streptomyces sp. NPDC060232]|uniref:hypothetical protein n=1 Tax=Streptomyces sp. NPDC060232 TaxID=3347079 RepID=UPI00365B7DC4
MFTHSQIAVTLNSEIAQHAAEVILAGSTSQAHTPVQALGTAVPFAAKALAVGVAFGSLLACLITTADRRQWMTGQSRRVLVLVTPLLVYPHQVERAAARRVQWNLLALGHEGGHGDSR